MSNETVSIDVLRTLAFGSISGTYAALGTKFTHEARIVVLVNNTDGDLFFSIDGVNDMIYLPATQTRTINATTNKLYPVRKWIFAPGTQFYVRQSTAPTKNSVALEAYY